MIDIIAQNPRQFILAVVVVIVILAIIIWSIVRKDKFDVNTDCPADLYPNCPDFANTNWCNVHTISGEAQRQCPRTCFKNTDSNIFCPKKAQTVGASTGVCKPDLYPNCPDFANKNWCLSNTSNGESSRQCPATCFKNTGNTLFCPSGKVVPVAVSRNQEKPVNCVLSDWNVSDSNFYNCSPSFTDYSKVRTKRILTQPSNGGGMCSPTSETYTCKASLQSPIAPKKSCTDLYPNCPDFANRDWCNAHFNDKEAQRQCPATCNKVLGVSSFC